MCTRGLRSGLNHQASYTDHLGRVFQENLARESAYAVHDLSMALVSISLHSLKRLRSQTTLSSNAGGLSVKTASESLGFRHLMTSNNNTSSATAPLLACRRLRGWVSNSSCYIATLHSPLHGAHLQLDEHVEYLIRSPRATLTAILLRKAYSLFRGRRTVSPTSS